MAVESKWDDVGSDSDNDFFDSSCRQPFKSKSNSMYNSVSSSPNNGKKKNNNNGRQKRLSLYDCKNEHDENILHQLVSFGFKEYHISEAFKYLNDNASLDACLDWLDKNPTNKKEENYHCIKSFINVFKSNNISMEEAYYIFILSHKEDGNGNNNNNNKNKTDADSIRFDLSRAIAFYNSKYSQIKQDNSNNSNNSKNSKNKNGNDSDISDLDSDYEDNSDNYSDNDDNDDKKKKNNNNNNNNNGKSDNGLKKYSNLSNNEKDEYVVAAAMLESEIEHLEDTRKDACLMNDIKKDLRRELREIGFFKYEIDLALNNNNNNGNNKRDAIKWILTNINDKQKHIAKMTELQQCGFTKSESEMALKKFENNFDLANLWLIQEKPTLLDHYMIHIESGSMLSIERKNKNNLVKTKKKAENDNSKLEVILTKDSIIRKNCQWSYFENGKIKNFENSLYLGAICRHKKASNRNYSVKKTYELALIDSMSMKIHNLYNAQTHSYSNDTTIMSNDDAIVKGTNWKFDQTHCTLQNEMCNLFLKTNKENELILESKVDYDDFTARWKFVNESQLNDNDKIYREMAQQIDNEIADNECIICFEVPTKHRMRLQPCKHDSFCYQCIKDSNITECPICRGKIQRRTKINCKSK